MNQFNLHQFHYYSALQLQAPDAVIKINGNATKKGSRFKDELWLLFFYWGHRIYLFVPLLERGGGRVGTSVEVITTALIVRQVHLRNLRSISIRVWETERGSGRMSETGQGERGPRIRERDGTGSLSYRRYDVAVVKGKKYKKIK